MSRTVYLFLHTHWDREWYRSFENYRTRLTRVLQEILDYLEADPQRVFLLDGQTVVLEDFLAIHPEAQSRLQSLISAERLHVGPWYVLPDEFLVSGEALIRNLQLGVRQAKAFGQKVFYGYLPDMFGHLAQIPQLLGQSKLAPALIWRGVNPKSAWFEWQGLHGDALPSIHLTKGYYMDALHQETIAWEGFEQFLNAIDAATPTNAPILMPIGADHMGLPANLDAKLAEIREKFPQYEFKLSSLPEYMSELQAAMPPQELKQGELRSASAPFAYVLPGVWSTRRYLKQANDQLQTLLERGIEPLTVLQYLGGDKPEGALLQQAWKYVLQNQPHDSICGCSIDEVHQDMLPRFRWAREIADDLRQQIFKSWGQQQSPPQPGEFLHLFNPSPAAFKGCTQVELMFAKDQRPAHFELQDTTGKSIPYTILGEVKKEVFVAEPDILPHWEDIEQVNCLISTQIPALSCQSLQIKTAEAAPVIKAGAKSSPHSIENAHCKIQIDTDKKRLKIYRKEDQTWIRCLEGNFFLSEGDAGDSYNYSAPFDDKLCEIIIQQVETSSTALSQTLKVSCQAFIPSQLQEHRQGRSRINVPIRIYSELTLYQGEPRVHVRTQLSNQAQDHRLRLLWLTPARSVKAWSSTAFGAVERHLQVPLAMDFEKGQERPADAFPYSEWIHVSVPDNQGWAIQTEGLHEAALVEWEGRAALSLTLLRSVGWLSRDDLRTRGGGAGPRMQTPEAQCIGEHIYDYSLHLCGNHREDALASLNQTRYPLQIFQGGKLKQTELFHIAPASVHLSALTLSQCGQAVVIRLVNESDDTLPFDLNPLFDCDKVTHTDPLEGHETPLTGHNFHRILSPGEMITLKFYPSFAEKDPDPANKETT